MLEAFENLENCCKKLPGVRHNPLQSSKIHRLSDLSTAFSSVPAIIGLDK